MAVNVAALTIEQALAISMNSELDAEKVYVQVKDMVHNFVLREKLDYLISEEKKHQKIIQALFDKKFPNAKLKLTDQRIYPALKLAMEENNSVPDLLEMGMEAERAAEEFYDNLAQEVEEDHGLQQILLYLAGMERSHYFIIKAEYELCVKDESYYERDDFQYDMVHIGP